MNIEQIARDDYNTKYSDLIRMGDPIYLGEVYPVKHGVGYNVRCSGSNYYENVIIDEKFLTDDNIKKYGIVKYHVDRFGERQFDPKFSGTKILDLSPKEFEIYLMSDLNIQKMKLIDSKMNFCKYLIIPNFTSAKSGSCEITMNNYQYLRSGYSSRRDGELSTLSRWFEFPIEIPKAKYLQIVLYSKDQLISESTSRNEEVDPNLTDWNVIAILGQDSGTIEPMLPITMMRNALGMEEGGNGHPLDIEEYQKSVDFWSKVAIIK